MSIYLYTVIKDGKATNSWTSNSYGPDHYEAAFGLPQREVPADQCSGSDLEASISFRTQVNTDGTTTTFYMLPAQYTVTITDITTEYNQAALDAYTTQRIATADADIQTLIGGISQTRSLMTALYHLCVCVNPLGNFVAADINASKAQIQNYLGLMAQVQGIFTVRDADISAKKASLGL